MVIILMNVSIIATCFFVVTSVNIVVSGKELQMIVYECDVNTLEEATELVIKGTVEVIENDYL